MRTYFFFGCSQFYLIEMKDKGNKSAFDFLRNRAKKTLTSSFENLITNVHHKTEEMRGAFRHRSGTNESEGGSFSKSTVCKLVLYMNS